MALDLRTAVPAGAAVLVLAAAAALAAHVPADRPNPLPRPSPSDSSTAGAIVAQPLPPPPSGVAWWVVVLGLVALLVVVGPLLWLLVRHGVTRRRRAARDGLPHDTVELTATGRLEEADAALAEAAGRLDEGGDPREVVIACWVRLEAAADAAGRGRRPAETATDVARRWLGSDDADRPEERAAVDDLAALFHEARYSRHTVTDTQRERARAALTGLLGTSA